MICTLQYFVVLNISINFALNQNMRPGNFTGCFLAILLVEVLTSLENWLKNRQNFLPSKYIYDSFVETVSRKILKRFTFGFKLWFKVVSEHDLPACLLILFRFFIPIIMLLSNWASWFLIFSTFSLKTFLNNSFAF